MHYRTNAFIDELHIFIQRPETNFHKMLFRTPYIELSRNAVAYIIIREGTSIHFRIFLRYIRLDRFNVRLNIFHIGFSIPFLSLLHRLYYLSRGEHKPYDARANKWSTFQKLNNKMFETN